MILTRKDLKYYLECDRIAMSQKTARPGGNLPYRFLIVMRKYEYRANRKDVVSRAAAIWWHLRYKRLSEKCGFSIPINCAGPGLCLPHYGTIVISGQAKIGENCKIHPGVCIGASSGKPEAKQIGNNVYIGPGAKLVGGGTIADNVVIGANAVVTGSVEEPGITIGGIPAQKISGNDSSAHLIRATEIAGKNRLAET